MMDKIKLDIGCGNSCREGYVGLDIADFGQKYKFDIEHKDLRELFKPNELEAVYASHFMEHLSARRVIQLVSIELPELMIDGGQLWIIVPSKDHAKAYSLWHRTFFTEFTFRNVLEEVTYHNNKITQKKPWTITELVTNERKDIHCKATLNKKNIIDLSEYDLPPRDKE